MSNQSKFEKDPYNPLISVIISAYNREETIRRSIDSVIRQTYSNIEIIVVDDGSTDKTVQEIGKVNDTRLRLIVLKCNSGASYARNRGIEEARGEFIAFQDSDDEWLPRKLEVQLSMADSNPCIQFFSCNLIRVCFSDRSAYLIPDFNIPVDQKSITRELLFRNFAWTQTWFVRRIIFDQGFRFHPEVVRAQDWDFALQVTKNFKIFHIDEVLVMAYETADSLLSQESHICSDLKIILANHQSLYSKHLKIKARQMRSIAYHSALKDDTKELRKWSSLCVRTWPYDMRNIAMIAVFFLGAPVVRSIIIFRLRYREVKKKVFHLN